MKRVRKVGRTESLRGELDALILTVEDIRDHVMPRYIGFTDQDTLYEYIRTAKFAMKNLEREIELIQEQEEGEDDDRG